MKVAVIKYNAGNIQSVRYALERLQVDFVVTDDAEEIKKADKVIFPGVGEASSTMAFLRDKKFDQLIIGLKQPVLGICLGMQLLCMHSEENDTPCLGIFEETVRKFIPTRDLKVPHMGWNSLGKVSGWVSTELENEFVYFVHSYFVPLSRNTVAETKYGIAFSAVMKKDNFLCRPISPGEIRRNGRNRIEKLSQRMRIIPAIDLIGGKCVRLTQGDYGQTKIYREDPLEVAQEFEDANLEYLHLIDLDGAKKGKVINWKVIEDIQEKTSLKVDFGGGVKTKEEVEELLDLGINQINIGSMAVKDPDLFISWMKEYGSDNFILGADVQDDNVMINGWLEATSLRLFDLVNRFENEGLNYLACTDIRTDGMLSGPNFGLYEKTEKSNSQN